MQIRTKTYEKGDTSTLLARIQTPQDTELTYSLIETPTSDQSGPVFSILCTLQTENGDDYDYDFVYDVSRTKERALELLNILCQGTVTPCTLKCVISDLLA